MKARVHRGAVVLALTVSACRAPPPAVPREPGWRALSSRSCFSSADKAIDGALSERVFPGGVLAIGRRAGLIHVRPFGRQSFAADSSAVEAGTLYDLASLTKAVATSMLAMALVDEGKLDLDAPVSRWLPDFEDEERRAIRVRNLLAHSAGLREWQPLYKEVRDKEALLRRLSEMDLAYEPGTKSIYSDLGPILLGAILERVTGTSLDEAARRWVFEPLGMQDTLYQPDASHRYRAAPTGKSRWRGRYLQGEVHDENAYRMAGVAGHAGLFSTALDLSRLAEMLLNGGIHRGRRFVRAETIDLFTRRVEIPGSSRTLGWETPAGDRWAGMAWSEAAFGHTGNTGTMMWLDPKQDVYVILLTNRVLAAESGEAFLRVRRQVSEAVLQAVPGCGATVWRTRPRVKKP